MKKTELMKLMKKQLVERYQFLTTNKSRAQRSVYEEREIWNIKDILKIMKAKQQAIYSLMHLIRRRCMPRAANNSERVMECCRCRDNKGFCDFINPLNILYDNIEKVKYIMSDNEWKILKHHYEYGELSETDILILTEWQDEHPELWGDIPCFCDMCKSYC